MYPLGHYGLALLFSAPLAYYLGKRTGTAFTLFALLATLLPDVDNHLPYVVHHGLTHTFAFAVLAGVVGGAVAAIGIAAYASLNGPASFGLLAPKRVFVYATVGVFLGTASHVVGDIFILFPGTQPVSPFWPMSERKFHVGFWALGYLWRNLLLLLLGLLAHAFAHLYSDGTPAPSPAAQK